MIDDREGFKRKPCKSQDSYFNDVPKMPGKDVQPSQKKAPRGPKTGA